MTNFAFTPPPHSSVAIEGSAERFPVRRVFCVGRNYADHAREMGGDPAREPPFFFGKPADTVVDSGATIPYPTLTGNLHHEIELVIAIGRAGSNISVADTGKHIWGFGVGVDLTRRDLQDQAKAARRPWTWSKGFDNSAPCGPLRPAANVVDAGNGRIWLAVNGQTRQDGDLAQMIWTVPEIVAACSSGVRLEAGDLIFTGTPAGVGLLVVGDAVTCGIDGVGTLDFRIGAPA
jgi:fumarylpyruvate hydrolase